MTKLLLLPGNSAGNRQSIEEIQNEIGGNILYYTHWETGEPMIDFQNETSRLVDMANGEPVIIFAKSAGTLLAMKAVREAGLRVEKAVFLGTAVNWGIERGIPVRAWLEDWRAPTLFVQNENDPVISAAELAAILDGRHTMLVLPGSHHDYNELDQFLPQVRGMLG